jgi:hypothetical protein
MQVVHVSLFEWLKKLPGYTAGPGAAPWPFLHSGVAPCEDVIQGQQREIDQMKQVLARLERREQRHASLMYRSPTGCRFFGRLDRANATLFTLAVRHMSYIHRGDTQVRRAPKTWPGPLLAETDRPGKRSGDQGHLLSLAR